MQLYKVLLLFSLQIYLVHPYSWMEFWNDEMLESKRLVFSYDDVVNVRLDKEFKLFNKTYKNVFISGNGYMTFSNEQKQQNMLNCKPNATDTPAIAVFAAPLLSNGSSTGKLLYRQYTVESILTIPPVAIVSGDVRKAFPDLGYIKLKWMLVVTWYNFEKASLFVQNVGPRNTFYGILATDGERSFVLYYYRNITYSEYKTEKGPATGVFGGHGEADNTYLVPGSCSKQLKAIDSMSNVNHPGKFVFRVDQTMITPEDSQTCNLLAKKGLQPVLPLKVDFNPRAFSASGKSQMLVNGLTNLCLKYGIEKVSCVFETTDGTTIAQAEGDWIPGNFAVFCVKPELDFVGLLVVKVEVQFSKGHYITGTGTILISVELTTDIGAQLENSGTAQVFVQMNLPKNPLDTTRHPQLSRKLQNQQSSEIQVMLLELGEKNWHLTESFACFDVGNCTKTLSAKDFKTITISDNTHTSLKAVLVRNTTDFGGGHQMFTSYFSDPINSTLALIQHRGYQQGRANVYDKRCRDWYNNEPIPANDTLPCPPNRFQVEHDWRFYLSTLASTQGAMNPEHYLVYLQSTPSPTGAGSLCVYNKLGNLELRPPYGSRIHRYSPNNENNHWKYYHNDIVPYLDCCALSFSKDTNCAKYFLPKRPPYQKNLYEFPASFRVTGANQITTLDGSTYLLNDVGWFWLASFENYATVEIYSELFSSQAKVFTGTVVTSVLVTFYNTKSGNLTKIQVSTGKTNGLLVWWNDQPLNFFHNEITNQTGFLEEVFITQQNKVSIVVNATTGITISVDNKISASFKPTAANHSIDIVGSVSAIVAMTLKGLIGKIVANTETFEGNLRDHVDFWREKEAQPLSKLPTGITKQFSNISMHFQILDRLSRSEILKCIPAPVAIFCKNDENCMVDYQLTGNEAFTQSALSSYEMFNSLKAVSETKRKTRECQIPGEIKNGNLIGTKRYIGSDIQYSCENGYDLQAKMKSREIHLDSWVFTCVPKECLVAPSNNLKQHFNQTWVNLETNLIINSVSLKCVSHSEEGSAFWIIAVSTITTSLVWLAGFSLYRVYKAFRRAQNTDNHVNISLLDLSQTEK